MLIVILIFSNLSFGQEVTDSLKIIADGIYCSRNSFKTVNTKVVGQVKDVVFVKVEDINNIKSIEYDSLIVQFSTEAVLFHFGVSRFVDLETIIAKKTSIKVNFCCDYGFGKTRECGFFMMKSDHGKWGLAKLMF